MSLTLTNSVLSAAKFFSLDCAHLKGKKSKPDCLPMTAHVYNFGSMKFKKKSEFLLSEFLFNENIFTILVLWKLKIHYFEKVHGINTESMEGKYS